MQNPQDRQYGGTYGSGSYSQSSYNQYPGGNQYPGQTSYGTSYGSHGTVGIGQTGYPHSGSYGSHQSGSYAGSRPPYGSPYDTHLGGSGGAGGIISDGSYPLGSPDRFGPGQIPSLSGIVIAS